MEKYKKYRVLTSYTYNSETVDEISNKIVYDFYEQFKALEKKLAEELEKIDIPGNVLRTSGG